MRDWFSFVLSAVALLAFAGSATAQIVVTPGTAITADGSPIMGVNTSDLSTLGIAGSQFEGTDPVAITDNNSGTMDTTWGLPGAPYSYAGIKGGTLSTVTTANAVTYLQVTFQIFVDGGWFGPNNTDPGGAVPLPAYDLIAPAVQVTTDGTTWTTVGAATNYVSQLTGADHNNNLSSNLVTFALDTPQSDIEGIRIIGFSGGTTAPFAIRDQQSHCISGA
jgi:hypothetical protein